MKLVLLLSAVLFSSVSANKCNDKKNEAPSSPATYKAKLETKALCMNYTLRLLEGESDTSIMTPTWTDESTGKAYQNVFGLANPCDFPASIQQGDEFYFVIDTTKTKQCAICMAYYPTPPKKLSIKVIER